MGINYYTAMFLSTFMNQNDISDNIDYSKTLTLGRQFLQISPKLCIKILTRAGKQSNNLIDYITSKGLESYYAEPFFKALGEGIVDSLDYSDYEGASIIHDLSIPVPDDLKNRFTFVFDGGLLEHVYNFPIALRNAMDMVSIGGHLVLCTPGNNWFGHGFYQFSPELFYSVLREENGFNDTKVFTRHRNKWYLIANPREIHRRTEHSPKWNRMSLYVISKKIAYVPENMTVSSFCRIFSYKKKAVMHRV